MRSPRAVYRERLQRGASEADRFVDMTTRVRVYRRDARGVARPAELLPHVYGGIWDRWRGEYTDDESPNPLELKVHPGQVRLLDSFDEPDVRRTLALAAPGGGKTEGIATVAACLALWYAGKPGGMVSPVQRHEKTLWKKFTTILPRHWIDDVRPGDGEILLANGSLAQFVSAKRQSASTGSPIAGFDWAWAIEDEQQFLDDDSIEEVNARGRLNADYRVWSSATNDALGYFQRRVQEYRGGGDKKLVTFPGPENVFTPLKHWAWIESRMDPAAYKRRFLALDLPIEGRVYPHFSMNDSVAPVPPQPLIGSTDITADVTAEKFREPYEYVVGIDFGMRVTASVILKCYRGPPAWGKRERQWWVVDEITTEHQHSDFHLAKLLEYFQGDVTKFIAFTGQDSNSTNPERSDFILATKRGVNIRRATYGKRLSVKHRYSMVNALLEAGDGRRRLFVACDANRRIKARLTADSFLLLMLNAADKAETHGKGTKGGDDRTHHSDALGYALYPFESRFGTDTPAEVDTHGNRATERA